MISHDAHLRVSGKKNENETTNAHWGGAHGWCFQDLEICSIKFAQGILGQQLSFQKTENQTGYPVVALKPTQGSGFSRSVQQKREKRAFRT